MANRKVEQRPTASARHREMSVVAEQIKVCRRCDGMNIPDLTQAAPGFGSVRSPVVIVGQSLCGPCMRRQEPFVGGSGKLLDAAFAAAQVDKDALFITNVVHCHPPRNRKSLPEWINNCSPYLHRELQIVRPKLVIGLGKDAEAALCAHLPQAPVISWPFRSPRISSSGDRGPHLHFVKHPSWIKRQHDDELERRYVSSLVRALNWSMAR